MQPSSSKLEEITKSLSFCTLHFRPTKKTCQTEVCVAKVICSVGCFLSSPGPNVQEPNWDPTVQRVGQAAAELRICCAAGGLRSMWQTESPPSSSWCKVTINKWCSLSSAVTRPFGYSTCSTNTAFYSSAIHGGCISAV